MSSTILEQFLFAARSITGAERGLVVDNDMHILQTANLDPAVAAAEDFIAYTTQILRDAIQRGEPIVTNNVITDPSKAPTTNTNFANLRVVVAIPVVGQGAVYLEKHIQKGVIDRDTVSKLMRLASEAIKDQQDHSESSLVEKYTAME